MPTATEIIVEEEGSHLREIASSRGWPLHLLDSTTYVVSLPARDNTWFHLSIECDRYKEQPPAFNWYNPETEQKNHNPDTPKGSGYFHGSGVICAPWNRLAYKQCDPRGPHRDWGLANWITNPNTGQTTTLSAMVLRISVELMSQRYQGRMG
jgi:hypothetical protein